MFQLVITFITALSWDIAGHVIDPCYNNLNYTQKIVISLEHVLFEAGSISNTGYLSSKFNIKESLMQWNTEATPKVKAEYHELWIYSGMSQAKAERALYQKSLSSMSNIYEEITLPLALNSKFIANHFFYSSVWNILVMPITYM